jgi:hypothetical protein
MRHARSNTKPVRRQPMATPVKKESKIRLSPSGVTEAIIGLYRLFRQKFILTIILAVLILIVYLIVGTRVFQIQKTSYVFKDTAEDCVSENLIKETYFKKKSFVWSHVFYDREILKKKYPCIDSLAFNWNPFSFNTLKVTVSSAKPVAQVLITRIEATTFSGLSEQYFNAQPIEEVSRYITEDGHFISFVSSPSVPKFRYRILKGQKIEDLHMSQKDLKLVLQLDRYVRQELTSPTDLDMAPEGSIRISAPIAEEIYVTLHDDLSIQLGSLQAILGTSTIDKKKIRQIDLRFGNPVVTFR